MDKTLAGVLGAVAALAVTNAHAAPVPPESAMQAASYSDLLQPIPDAAALLAALPEAESSPAIETVQYHHHHHHHHHWWRHRRWRHGRWYYYR